MDPAALEAARKEAEAAALPPLPPLLAQILAQTRAKQQAAKEGRPYEEPKKEGEEAAPTGGPLLLEGPSSGLIVQGSAVPERRPDEYSDSDSDAEPEAPLGPLDPARCRVHGPGFSGAAAGAPVKLTLTARDSNGKRIKEGGAHVLVMVEPPPPPLPGEEAEEPEPIQAEVEDHGNGTYTAVYTVPVKGNYQLHIEVNGEPVGDSPYPLFFSAPKEPKAAAGGAAPPPPPAAQGAAPLPPPVLSAAGIPVVTAEALRAQQLGGGDAAAAAAPVAPAPVEPVVRPSLGAELARLGIRFPPTPPDQLARMVIVGGVPSAAKSSEIKDLFAEYGRVRTCSLAGAFAFIEFERSKYAGAALKADGQEFQGARLRVEGAAVAKQAADAAFAAANAALNPYAALQAAQVQHFQMLQQQQVALAAQVATMRAAHRVGIDPSVLIARDVAAAAAAPAAAPAAAANGGERRRSRSRSRDRRRRSRSRSRDRDRRSSRRSRSRDRDRRRRSRSRSRDRRRRSRSRSRDRDRKHKHHHHKHRHHRRRSKEREGKEGTQQGEAMEVDGAAAEQQQQQQQQQAGPKDDLEALLDEFEG